MQLTADEIRMQMKLDVEALIARHQTELAELRERHRDERKFRVDSQARERSALNASHMELWRHYSTDKATGPQRVIAHNADMRKQGVRDLLTIKYGFAAKLDADYLSEICERLTVMQRKYPSLGNRKSGASPEQNAMLKIEQDYRKAAVILANNDASVVTQLPRVSQSRAGDDPESLGEGRMGLSDSATSQDAAPVGKTEEDYTAELNRLMNENPVKE